MPPITASSIAEQAFRLMELGPLSSFGDDSPEARDAADLYPTALRAALEAADWSFASRQVQLPEVVLDQGHAAELEMPHAYALPGDCVVLRDVMTGLRGRWRLDRRFLRASVPGPLPVRFTALVEGEDEMPATFRLALSYSLAVLLGPRWLTTHTKLDRLQRTAEEVMRRAMRTDARMASQMPALPVDWVREARL